MVRQDCRPQLHQYRPVHYCFGYHSRRRIYSIYHSHESRQVPIKHSLTSWYFRQKGLSGVFSSVPNLGRKGIHVQLLFERSWISRINPVFITENDSFGICIPTVKNRISTCLFLPVFVWANKVTEQQHIIMKKNTILEFMSINIKVMPQKWWKINEIKVDYLPINSENQPNCRKIIIS